MRKTFYIASALDRANLDGACLAKSLSSQIRGNCKKVSGPHRLTHGWDINCTFGSTEVWLMLRRGDRGWQLVLDTVWDLPALFLRKSNPDLCQFEIQLQRWINQYAASTNCRMHPSR